MTNRPSTIGPVSASVIVGALLLGSGVIAIVSRPFAPPPATNEPSVQFKTALASIVPERKMAIAESRPARPLTKEMARALDGRIDPNTPLSELLPAAPRERAQTPSAFVETLADVPEVMLTDPLEVRFRINDRLMVKGVASQIARIDHLNQQKPDGFLIALLNERPDLAGLPFQMGSDCRMPAGRSFCFKEAVAMVHQSHLGSYFSLDRFMHQAEATPFQKPGMRDWELVNSTRVAAVAQICGPESHETRLSAARYLASVSSAESTRALAKIVLFTPEEDIRDVAVTTLKARREQDYTDLLLQGFRYPWPEVAGRVGDALVKLERKDLAPQIADVLDEPDPRAPTTRTVDGKSVTTVREIVRLNHHRNCLMCHAPGHDVRNDQTILTAETPVPGQPFPSSNSGSYGSQGNPELLVRVDVTYLRQDFSVMLPVDHSAPWPAMQRFDFVARTRTLNDDQVEAYKQKFDKIDPDNLPPNRRAALLALRGLTGKNAAPTAEAWRSVVQAK